VILSHALFFAISTSSIRDYWDDEVLPAWARLRTIAYCADQIAGYGAEPHFHDNDEFWFFTSGGRGEAWLDGERYEVGPNTIIYTPMGAVHRFQMFEPFTIVGIRSRLEGKRRKAHLHPPEDGLPVPTDRGLVVPGEANTGPIVDAPARCPVRETRVVPVGPGAPFEVHADSVVYILAVEGTIRTTIDGLALELTALQQTWGTAYATATTAQGDLLVVRPDVALRIEASQPVNVVFIRQ
jgi:mannose-6-phosphate isomerase-like protein (cupin superfamily)